MQRIAACKADLLDKPVLRLLLTILHLRRIASQGQKDGLDVAFQQSPKRPFKPSPSPEGLNDMIKRDGNEKRRLWAILRA